MWSFRSAKARPLHQSNMVQSFFYIYFVIFWFFFLLLSYFSPTFPPCIAPEALVCVCSWFQGSSFCFPWFILQSEYQVSWRYSKKACMYFPFFSFQMTLSIFKFFVLISFHVIVDKLFSVSLGQICSSWHGFQLLWSCVS